MKTITSRFLVRIIGGSVGLIPLFLTKRGPAGTILGLFTMTTSAWAAERLWRNSTVPKKEEAAK
jgi:hypothetical protein